MMLERYYRINQAAGISIEIAEGGQAHIAACSISVVKSELTIDRKNETIGGLEKLKAILPAKTFVSLNLSGRGVLYKQVEKTTEIDTLNFSKILPNANLDDFYVQHFTSGDSSFVAVVRRSEADSYIRQLRELGFISVMLSLGPFPVQLVLPQLNFYDQELVFDGYTITRNEQADWLSCAYNAAERAKFPIKVQSETLDERLVVPYAAAFQLVLSDRLNPVQAQCGTLSAELENVLQERRLKARGFAALAVFFILLLINFVVFSGLNASNSSLLEQVSRTAQNNDDLEKINSTVEKKQALLNILGWEGNISKSSLIDQVASLLPPELTWREAVIDPVDLAESRRQKSIVFATRKIRITGTSEKIIPVNEWIARIKTRPWVKNVNLDSYSFNSELNTGQFTILIDY